MYCTVVSKLLKTELNKNLYQLTLYAIANVILNFTAFRRLIQRFKTTI